MHRFPKDGNLKKLWLHAVRRVNFNPSNTAVICEKHFREDDYEINVHGNKVLKKQAIPSKFDVPAHLIKVIRKRKPITRRLHVNQDIGDLFIILFIYLII